LITCNVQRILEPTKLSYYDNVHFDQTTLFFAHKNTRFYSILMQLE